MIKLSAVLPLIVVGVSGIPLQAQAPQVDHSPHKISLLSVEPDVKLEILDWGGTGRPMVLLTGLGNNAHVFDGFAEKLTSRYHVYGITRRGFGASSVPEPMKANYTADRLADDVLAVIDKLKLNRPILVGHSIAGEELSSIGSRYPEKVAGLVYLDAGYKYAFFDPKRGDIGIDINVLQEDLSLLNTSMPVSAYKAKVREVLGVDVPQFQTDLLKFQGLLQGMPDTMPAPVLPPDTSSPSAAIVDGSQKYTTVKCPVLAIFAIPKDGAEGLPPHFGAEVAAQADSFEHGIPSAHVVRLMNAEHYVFQSNEKEVLGEINAFAAKLPQ